MKLKLFISLALAASLTKADIIVAPGFAYPGEWNGDWLGTFTGLPITTR